VTGEAIFNLGPEDFQQAEWLAHYMDREWRFDHTAERWHHWDGNRWAPDQTRQVERRVAELAATNIANASTDGERKALIKLLGLPATRRALEALATFPDYGTNGDDWDAIPHLLGTESGIMDLRTNSLITKPDPSMLVTKSTGCKIKRVESPADFDDAAPIFMQVMRDWMSGDDSMVAFLLLWFGASLFGFTPEQRFLLMTGIGRNGKGALKHSVMKAVGEYGGQYDANLYMRTRFGAARSDQARADLIALKGKRITFFSEPEGGRFNDELLKAHTGGDRITARALHSNNVQSWDPTHSITFLVNNAPEVEDLGPSMAARVMVADFRERYDGDKEDKRLYGKLEREAEGILGILCWAASAWHASWSEGLGGIELPERVKEQSKAFMERNDPVANWLNERAEFDADGHCASQVAYESFLSWFSHSDTPGEAPSSVKWAQAMEKKGLRKEKTKFGMRWKGFRLLNAMALAERGIGDDEDETP
jgi:putative DNA primase/helicase